jgi:molybdopterin-biosynthesis enzyme MoeA-like protein
LEEMNTTSNRMADRYGEPLPEEPKPNWIKYIEEILINREELLETAKRKTGTMIMTPTIVKKRR